jgi:hypothetical protein
MTLSLEETYVIKLFTKVSINTVMGSYYGTVLDGKKDPRVVPKLGKLKIV